MKRHVMKLTAYKSKSGICLNVPLKLDVTQVFELGRTAQHSTAQ